MANVPESASYDAGIYQIEIVDAVIGGVNGISNLQAKGLANRTNWLKAQVDALNALKGTGIAAFSAGSSYVGGQQAIYQKNIWQANTAIVPGAWNAANWTRQLGTSAEGELSSTLPVIDGVAAIGTSTAVARADHKHPTDTTRAPLASPTFTGTPTAPTAADGTNTTQLASTAFVQAAVGGYLLKSTTGGTVTLTDAEASNPVIAFSGALTSNSVIVLPVTTKRLWAIYNSTSGAFTLTVKTAAGSGVTVAQGKRNLVYTDGTNIYDAFNDFESISITGVPTAPTAAPGTNTTQLASTAFVQAAVGGYLLKSTTGGTVTLTDAEASNPVIAFSGALTSNSVIVLPVTTKRLWAIYNSTSGAFTLTVKTAAGSGVTVAQGKRNLVYTDGTNIYDAFNDFESISITGVPTAPTAAPGTNTTQLASTAFVQAQLAATFTAASETVAGKVELATAAETTTGTDNTRAVHPAGLKVELDKKAPLASPALTGTPTAPTQAASDSSTKIANTAFTANAVKNNGFAVSTGSANAYVCAFTPVIAARSEGQLLRFKANFANTGASTINDGLGAVALVGVDHSALQGGEIAANGDCLAQWNTSVGGGSYILLISTGVAATPLSQAAVVGGVRNARMAVTVSLATATFTADEIGVKTALGGSAWLLSNFSKTINLGTIGADGMDAVGPPTNGWVALYAIYNPTTAVSALLAVDVSSSVAPEVYGGASMPAGYTASALVSVWKIQASKFVIANQVDRSLSFPYIQVANSGAQIASLTSVSIAGAVPSNAIACGGFMAINGTDSTNAITVLASTAGGVGQVQVAGNSTTGGIQNISSGPFSGMKIITSRTLYWQAKVTTGTFGGGTVYVSSYDF